MCALEAAALEGEAVRVVFMVHSLKAPALSSLNPNWPGARWLGPPQLLPLPSEVPGA